MDYNGPPASEYRLNIDGISVFCPCGEFLWVFDGSSKGILRVHIRKCRIYKGVKNFKYTKIISEFKVNFAKKVSRFAIHEFSDGGNKYFCTEINCHKRNIPFQWKKSAHKHQHEVSELESVYHVSHPQHLIRKGALEELRMSLGHNITDVGILPSSDNIYNVDPNSLENIGGPNLVEISAMLEGRNEDIYTELTARYFPSLNIIKETIESRVSNIHWEQAAKKWLELGIGLKLEPSYLILVMNFGHREEDNHPNRSSFKMPQNTDKTLSELKYLINFLFGLGRLNDFEPDQKFVGIIILKNLFPLSVTPKPDEATIIDQYITERTLKCFNEKLSFRSSETIKQSFNCLIVIIRLAILNFVLVKRNNGWNHVESISFVKKIMASVELSKISANLYKVRQAAEAESIKTNVSFDPVSKDIHIELTKFSYSKYCNLAPILCSYGMRCFPNNTLSTIGLEDMKDLYEKLAPILFTILYSLGGAACRGSEVERIKFKDCKIDVTGKFYFNVMSRKRPTNYGRNDNVYGKLIQHSLDSETSKLLAIYLNGIRPCLARSDLLFGKSCRVAEKIKDTLNKALGVSVTDLYIFRHFFSEIVNRIEVILGIHGNHLVNNLALTMGHSLETHLSHYTSNNPFEAHSLYHSVFSNCSSLVPETSSIVLERVHILQALKQLYSTSASFRENQETLVEAMISNQANHYFFGLGCGVGKSISWLLPHLAYRAAGEIPNVGFLIISPYKSVTANHMAIAQQKLKGLSISIANVDDDGNLDFYPFPHIVFASISSLSKRKLIEWAPYLSRIVIDEAHVIISEQHFRKEFDIFQELPSLMVPLILLSGSAQLADVIVDQFNLRKEDVKIITSDVGVLPEKVHIELVILNDSLRNSTTYCVDLCNKLSVNEADCIHILVQTRFDAENLSNNIEGSNFLTSETESEQRSLIVENWINGKIKILISTSCGVSGINNTKVKYVFFYGCPLNLVFFQQGVGRIRGSGSVYVLISKMDNKYQFQNQLSDIKNHLSVNCLSPGETNKVIETWFDYSACFSYFMTKECRKVLFFFHATNRRIRNCMSCDICKSSKVARAAILAKQNYARRENNSQRYIQLGKQLLLTSFEKCLVCKSTSICRCIVPQACFRCCIPGHNINDCPIKGNLQNILGSYSKTCYTCFRWTVGQHELHPPGNLCRSNKNKNFFKAFLKYMVNRSSKQTSKGITKEILKELYWENNKLCDNNELVYYRLGYLYANSGLDTLE